MKDDTESVLELTPGLVLRAYAAGVFPMADSADAQEVFWVDPRRRGVLPLDDFHLSKSLRKTVLKGGFRVTIDRDFPSVLDGCADRDETWINPVIHDLYLGLHRMGHGHSVEVWQGDLLVGGLYGVRLGAAFFGESMFSRVTDASKVALVHLVARLIRGGFTLLDTQFTTPHLERMGARTVSRAKYHAMLDEAMGHRGNFFALADCPQPEDVVQLITQTSKRG